MTRTGKIARLPRALRAELNRRLEQGAPGRQLVAWLNAQPEVQAMLAAEFGDRPIHEQNLTAWKQGGFLEWQRQQEELALARELAAHSGELAQTSPEPLSDAAAPLLMAKYLLLLKNLNAVKMDEPDSWQPLRAVCRDLLDLRRGDHGAARLKLERERLAIVREQWQCERQEAARQRRLESRKHRKLTGAELVAKVDEIMGIKRPHPHAPADQAELSQIKLNQATPPPDPPPPSSSEPV